MKSFFKKLSLSVSVCILIFSCNILNFAQDLDDVTLNGKITDSNNLPIVGASVTARQVELGIERTVTTDSDGRYRIIELQPGLYKITASAAGFGTKEKIDVQTISGQTAQIDFQLAPADVQAETVVSVSAEDAPAVDTTRTVVGGTVTELELEELPNVSREALDLVFTLGGVTEEPLSTRDLSADRGQRGVNQPGTTPEEAGIFAL
jgi:hypothetical protein